MSKEAKAPAKINWSALKTNIIVAFAFTAAGLIGGYFMSINVINSTQADVISNIKAASNVLSPKESK